MLHLHGITLLMCARMVLGKRLRFFEQIVHRKVKCWYKRPAFRDYYHKSFAFRFHKLGFRTLTISPQHLESNQWIRSFKFWKPGWHVRLKSVRKGLMHHQDVVDKRPDAGPDALLLDTVCCNLIHWLVLLLFALVSTFFRRHQQPTINIEQQQG
jgi:hypothetical protein